MSKQDDVKPVGWLVSETYAMTRKIYRHLRVGEEPSWSEDDQSAQRQTVNEQTAYLEGQLQTCWGQRDLDKARVEFLDAEVAQLRQDNAVLRDAHLSLGDSPLLGLASTEELFRELLARFRMDMHTYVSVERALTLAEMLGGMSANEREYKTVDLG